MTAGNTMDVRGSEDDPEFQVVAAPARDDFDNWSEDRDNYLLKAQSQRYNKAAHGVEDLDSYGRWDYDPLTVGCGRHKWPRAGLLIRMAGGFGKTTMAGLGLTIRPGAGLRSTTATGITGWALAGPGIRVRVSGAVWWRPAMVGFFGWGRGSFSWVRQYRLGAARAA